MKTIITLISIIGFQYVTLAQTGSKRHATANPLSPHVSLKTPKVTADHLRAKFTPTPEKGEVTITSIPVLENALNTVNINFDMVGSFSFKKHESLEIPFNYEVFIEDKATGRVFNLKTSEAYTFNAEENVPNRFVMHVLDKTNMEAVLSMR